jgi:hypothetical protein
MDHGQIISALAVLVTGVVGFLARRSIKEQDDKVKILFERLAAVDSIVRGLEKDAVRAQVLDKSMDEVHAKLMSLVEMRADFLDRLGDYIKRGDFVRDIQIVTNQIEAIHKKIDYMDSKWDRLRDKQ